MSTITLTFDVVVYGGWSGNGVAEAIAAARESTYSRDVSVALVVEGKWVGGMLCQSFTSTDIGNALLVTTTSSSGPRSLYNGMFVTETGEWYGTSKDYKFEPNVGQSICLRALAAAGVRVFVQHPINRPSGVQMTGTTITSITCTNGGNTIVFNGTQFFDASVEADVLQQVGVEGTDWMVGRESAATYGEALAGYNQAPSYVTGNPFVSAGTLYPQVLPAPPLSVGDGDNAVQAPAYRVTLSDQVGNMQIWAGSGTYPADPKTAYGLESIVTPTTSVPSIGGVAPGKFCSNDNVILINTDASIGTTGVPVHWLWPKASYVNRRKIEALILDWQKNKYAYFANDTGRAGAYQLTINQFGLAKDEFTGNSFWPNALYVREGARMIGQYVVCQQDLQVTDTGQTRNTTKSDSLSPIGYSIDIHQVAYYDVGGSTTQILLEGTRGSMDGSLSLDGAAMPARALRTKSATCVNLLVTYCASLSHVAWGSFRELWQPFSAGEGAGCWAGYAVVNRTALDSVSISIIEAKLRTTYGCITNPIWNNSVAYTVGAIRQNKTHLCTCTQAGISASTGAGPLTVGTGVVDGTCQWTVT